VAIRQDLTCDEDKAEPSSDDGGWSGFDLRTPPEEPSYPEEPSFSDDGYPKVVELPDFDDLPDAGSARKLPEAKAIKGAVDKLKNAADPTRLRILLILDQGTRNVTQLCDDLGSQSQPAVSHHLALLRHADLVESRRDGKHNYYELADDGQALASLIQRII
jgi:DNA-binding transcriptional ArsR family regulator